MKKNNTLKVLLIAILATFLLTWILPIAYYNNGIMGGFGEFLNLDYRYPAGIFDILAYYSNFLFHASYSIYFSRRCILWSI